MPHRVLVIDDDQLLVNAITRMLKRLGWDAHSANTSLEGLQVLREWGEELDVALVDISLGREHGLEAAEALWQEQPELPVVLMSGRSRNQLKDMLDGIPISGFLYKPFDPHLMDDMLRSASGRT